MLVAIRYRFKQISMGNIAFLLPISQIMDIYKPFYLQTLAFRYNLKKSLKSTVTLILGIKVY